MLCHCTSGSQALCFLALCVSSGSKMDSEEIPSCETMVTSVVPSCWSQPWCYSVIASHIISIVLWNKLAITEKIWAEVLHSSCCPRKDVSILHPTWENLAWEFPLKWPLVWLPGCSDHSRESLQKRAVANILNHSANNNICNVLWEKSAGMIMEKEVGRKKGWKNLFWTESIPKNWRF